LGDNILLLDYVAEIGLIKRSIRIKDITITGSEGPEGIGYFDSKDESNLIRLGF
jgi:hypothetical protein